MLSNKTYGVSAAIVRLLFLFWGIGGLFLPLCTTAQSAKSNAIAQYVALLQTDSLFQSASMSILVTDAKTKKIIASLHPQTALIPASTLKLVTTGLSLISLGPNYRFQTSLYYDGTISDSTLQGNLYVTGGGDPTFGSLESIAMPIDTVFSQWTNALKSEGIKQIKGEIIADERFFERDEIPESWMWGDIGNYYGTCVSGLSFCENAYHTVVLPGKKEGDATTLSSIYPSIPNADFVNTITTGKRNSGNNTVIYNSPYSNKYLLTGTVAAQRDSFIVKGSNRYASYTCIGHFRDYLIIHGVGFEGLLDVLSETQTASSSKIVLATHNSPTLKEIVSVTNKKSNNFYAETLLKTIGLKQKQNSSYDSSLVAVAYLLDSLNISRTGFQMRDGSGLSRKDYLSAQFLNDFLYTMYNTNSYNEFLATLATAGDKGTFEKILLSAPLKKRLHGKSGSMESVRAYAGYSENPNGTIIFTILINNFNYKISALQPKIEKLLQLITEY